MSNKVQEHDIIQDDQQYSSQKDKNIVSIQENDEDDDEDEGPGYDIENICRQHDFAYAKQNKGQNSDIKLEEPEPNSDINQYQHVSNH